MRSICLLAAFAVSVFASGCGLIEEVDGPRREDFAISPAKPEHDQNDSPVTASELSRRLMQVDVEEPIEPDLVNVFQQAPVVPR